MVKFAFARSKEINHLKEILIIILKLISPFYLRII